MHRTSGRIYLLLAVPVVCDWAAAQTSAPPPPAPSLLKALDQPTTLAIDRVQIDEALDLIGKLTGVKVVISPATKSLLPYGPETAVRVTMRGVPLHQGLAGMVRPIAMTFVLHEDHVEIVPTPPLYRLGRRPQRDELTLLDRLTKTPWSRGSLDQLPLAFDIPAQTKPGAALRSAAEKVGAGSAAEVLEMACVSLGWSWMPSGEQIVVFPRERLIARQLERTVSAHYVRQPIVTILDDLSRQVRLPIRLDPGALQLLPPDSRERVSIIARGVTLRSALSQLATATGLVFSTDAAGVHMQAGPTLTQAASRDAKDPVVATIRITLDGEREVELPIRESDCPVDLKTFLANHRRTDVRAVLESAEADSNSPQNNP